MYELHIIDYLLSIKDRLEANVDTEEYTKAKLELDAVFREIFYGNHGVRAAVILCYLFPEYLPVFAEPMLDPVIFLSSSQEEAESSRSEYLPMFLRLFADKLSPQYVSRALGRIAIKGHSQEQLEYGNPATLYLAFATLDPANQLANATKVARYLFNMKNEYYLAKFFFYWRRILGYTDHAEMNRMFFYQFNLTEEWLDEWLEGMRREGRERIAKYKAMADTAGKPLLSPDSAIIKDREGFRPQFIVLHSSGAGSPVERVCEMFLRPDCKVTAHFVVATDGRVFQLVDLKDGARTNKTDNNPESDTYYRFARHDFFRNHSENANNFTVTIECEEFGYHGAITEPQKNAILALFRRIEKECGIPIDHKHVIGHRDIAPLTRSYCPGSRFPMQELIERHLTHADWRPLPTAEILSPAELI